MRGQQAGRLKFAVYQEYLRNLSVDQSRFEQAVQMRAESLQRSLGQLRQDHRAAEMHPSVARPHVSAISVMPALPTFAVVFERIIRAQIVAGSGNQCRRPWLRIQNGGLEDFTGVLWLKEHYVWIRPGCATFTPRASGRLGALGLHVTRRG